MSQGDPNKFYNANKPIKLIHQPVAAWQKANPDTVHHLEQKIQHQQKHITNQVLMERRKSKNTSAAEESCTARHIC